MPSYIVLLEKLEQVFAVYGSRLFLLIDRAQLEIVYIKKRSREGASGEIAEGAVGRRSATQLPPSVVVELAAEAAAARASWRVTPLGRCSRPTSAHPYSLFLRPLLVLQAAVIGVRNLFCWII